MSYLRKACALAASLVAAACAACGGEGRARAPEVSTSPTQTRTPARLGEIRFPKRWLEDDPAAKGHHAPADFELPIDPQQLEVRRAAGSDEYLFRALEYNTEYESDYQTDLPRPRYSRNVFAVDFRAGFRVREASLSEWDAAARVSNKPHMLSALSGDEPNEQGHSKRREIEYLGKKFASTGEYWRESALSPKGRWLAVFSYSGRIPAKSFFDFLGGGGPRRGDIFLDLYDTATGEKVLAWEARGAESPMWWNTTALWVGDKYFVWDAAPNSEALAVAELPDLAPVRTPGEVRFPRWLTADGSPMPARTRLEVRRPAQGGARELLFAARAEVEREVRYLTDDRPQREAVMRRTETVYSADFYAVSLDGEYRVRAATGAEWQAARKVDNKHYEFDVDETYVYEGRRRRHNRPLPASGAAPASPSALSGGSHWVAVFSLTNGEAFVDVYERLTGLKLSEGRFPLQGPPAEALAGAFWADESYLVVPTGGSASACLLFMLPELNGAR